MVIQAPAANPLGGDILKLLLDLRGKQLPNMERVVLEVAKRWRPRNEEYPLDDATTYAQLIANLKLLLEQKGWELLRSKAVKTALVEFMYHRSPKTLRIFVTHIPISANDVETTGVTWEKKRRIQES